MLTAVVIISVASAFVSWLNIAALQHQAKLSLDNERRIGRLETAMLDCDDWNGVEEDD